MSLSDLGNIADLNKDDTVDFTDFALVSNRWESKEILLAEDLNRDGKVDFSDVKVFAEHWLEVSIP